MIYEYECPACGVTFEVEQSIKDPPLDTCPGCWSKQVKRLISGGTGFQLKGDGWAKDLYGSKRPVDKKASGEND